MRWAGWLGGGVPDWGPSLFPTMMTSAAFHSYIKIRAHVCRLALSAPSSPRTHARIHTDQTKVHSSHAESAFTHTHAHTLKHSRVLDNNNIVLTSHKTWNNECRHAERHVVCSMLHHPGHHTHRHTHTDTHRHTHTGGHRLVKKLKVNITLTLSELSMRAWLLT